jgi:HlyD family secretion protein
MRGWKMRTKAILIGAVVLATLTALHFATARSGKKVSGYQFGEITRGDIENVVTATGTLSAVGTVEIGTQTSGTIAKINVDYNDKVSKGQVLAVLDTTLLYASVQEAEAGLASAQAQYEEANVEYQRSLQLMDKGLISDQEFLPAKVLVKTREAGVKSAAATLARTEVMLRNAIIISPIDGTVIERSVEPGQTVAASLSAPTLFIVAEDLTDMEIHAAVDENDIGQIKEAQAARFTVQAYADETFGGTVRQIQLQPSTVQNVVNYTVVVDAPNGKGLLLPGMTATVDFLIEQRKGVLLVPNTALRLTPTEEMLAQARPAPGDGVRTSQGLGGKADGAGNAGLAGGGRPAGTIEGSSTAQAPGAVKSAGTMEVAGGDSGKDLKQVWYLGADGLPARAIIEAGVTDGHSTEIVSGDGFHEGMQVITGVGDGEQAGGAKQSGPGGPPFRVF